MVIGKLLKSSDKTVCTAESCTGGEVAHLLTSVAGSSAYYKGSVIAYANSVKTQLLGVGEEIIEKHGAVSQETVKDMAIGARKIIKNRLCCGHIRYRRTRWWDRDKASGTIWIAVASGKEVICEKHVFGNDRNTNINRFTLAALNLLRKQIIKS